MAKSKSPPTYTAYQVFVEAESFLYVASNAHADMVRKLERGERSPQTLAPSIACGAFALELFMKALKLIDTPTEAAWDHNLLDLFYELPPARRDRIRAIYDEASPRKKAMIAKMAEISGHSAQKTVEDVLTASAEAFKNFRYFFEGKADSWEASAVIYATRQTILEIEPAWGPPLTY